MLLLVLLNVPLLVLLDVPLLVLLELLPTVSENLEYNESHQTSHRMTELTLCIDPTPCSQKLGTLALFDRTKPMLVSRRLQYTMQDMECLNISEADQSIWCKRGDRASTLVPSPIFPLYTRDDTHLAVSDLSIHQYFTSTPTAQWSLENYIASTGDEVATFLGELNDIRRIKRTSQNVQSFSYALFKHYEGVLGAEEVRLARIRAFKLVNDQILNAKQRIKTQQDSEAQLDREMAGGSTSCDKSPFCDSTQLNPQAYSHAPPCIDMDRTVEEPAEIPIPSGPAPTAGTSPSPSVSTTTSTVHEAPEPRTATTAGNKQDTRMAPVDGLEQEPTTEPTNRGEARRPVTTTGDETLLIGDEERGILLAQTEDIGHECETQEPEECLIS
ncbi:hypothetical protein EDD21DRAFT_358953 [Dissophora ornata]|nr:hypothetical protein EDD21DRAFT_358953 [Dissophora ornata]